MCGGFEKSRLKEKNKERKKRLLKKYGWNKSLIFHALGALLATAAACLLGQEDGLDVGQHASLGDGDSLEQFVQLLVVADGQLQVAGVDPLFLVVTGGVSSQLKDLGG